MCPAYGQARAKIPGNKRWCVTPYSKTAKAVQRLLTVKYRIVFPKTILQPLQCRYMANVCLQH